MELESLDPPRRRPGLEELLPMVSVILGKGAVTETLIVTGGRVAQESARLYYALKMLGPRLAPISRAREPIHVALEDLDFYWEFNRSRARVFRSSLELLYGNWPTPLVKLRSLSSDGRNVWGKLEAYNPYSWSIKDRVAWSLLQGYIEEHGRPPARVYEATSTNTGLALAALGAVYGFGVRVYIPGPARMESMVLLSLLGSEIVWTDKPITIDSLDMVKQEARAHGAVCLDQFNNDYNFMVHVRYTAKEIDYQARSAGLRLRGIYAGMGTSGHMAALSLYFKERWGIGVVGVQPSPGERIPGIRRIETGMKWIRYAPPSRIIDVSLEEALEMVERIARKDGLLVGLSSGAVAAAFEKTDPGEGDYVLVMPDNALKYTSIIWKMLGD